METDNKLRSLILVISWKVYVKGNESTHMAKYEMTTREWAASRQQIVDILLIFFPK